MATLGGGPPMLSLLTGVAQGISSHRERERRERDQAIINRLREQQIATAEANIETTKQREDARRVQAEAEAAEMAARREAEAAQQAQRNKLVQEFITAREAEILESGLTEDPNAARLKAMLEAQEQDFDQFMQAPEEPEGPTVSEQRFLQQSALEQDVKDILNDNELRHAVSVAPTLDEAIAAGQGRDPLAIAEAWKKLGGGEIEPTDGGKDFKLSDDALEAIQNQASGEADKMILQAITFGATEENAAAVALAGFNEKMQKIREAQAQGAHISNAEMATLEAIYNELIVRTRR